MWILQFLPDSFILYVVYSAIVLGAVGLLASYIIKVIPFLNIYRIPIQILSILLLTAGVYWYGGYSTEMWWRGETARLQEEIRKSEERAPVITKEVVTKYKDKILKTALTKQKCDFCDRMVIKNNMLIHQKLNICKRKA